FWIVQSRPVTAGPQSAAERTADNGGTRANLAEVLPEQLSPQALAAYEDLLNRAEREFMGGLLAPDAILGPVMKAFHGRLYMNLTQMRRVAAIGGAPPADLLRSLGPAGAMRPEDHIVARVGLRERLACV